MHLWSVFYISSSVGGVVVQRGNTGNASLHKELNKEVKRQFQHMEQFESDALNHSSIFEDKIR